MSCAKSPTDAHPLKGLSLDERFYLPGADLHFRVEKTLYRVHSYFFTRESPQFRERMTANKRTRTHTGISEKTAIPVEDVSPEEFSHFLWVFYNPDYHHSAAASVWRTILTLSSSERWDFPKVHALALSQLNNLPLPLVDRIILYKACSVSMEHIVPLYAELCLRDSCVTLQEAVRLGWELYVPITQVRERLLRGEGRGMDGDDMASEHGVLFEGVSKDRVLAMINTALSVNEENLSVMGLCDTRGPSTHREPGDRVQFEKSTGSPEGKHKRVPQHGEGSQDEVGGKCAKARAQGAESPQRGLRQRQQAQVRHQSMSFGRDSTYVVLEKSTIDAELLVLPGTWV